ncbi:type VI secretion system lipoprotein TssJ [Xenorhabdus sp. XENO-10]|uniref:Type VI secretion system lipoprotein TssJ n=1 Tax=Xenorhabdus yunnanensis TaxID=3025878 RepID=A0ABT5LGJ1_9GAMM|nr:type VI secretion system lipoprotein TssJ [Xenorhabdus yunnanensis]MDC9590230.1 type VI secretion system lipoprotein TssJ [Xenorhabdus yunnanensis]
MVNIKNATHEKSTFSDKIFCAKIIYAKTINNKKRDAFSINRLSFKWAMMILLFFPLITLTGCSSSEQKKLPPYNLIFYATNNVNDSSPLKIRVFLLKSNSRFISADLFSLQDNAQKELGNSLINSDAFFLLPSQHKYFLLEKNTPEASYIGILAEYKQLNGKKWRISLPVPSPKKSAFYKFWVSPPDTLDIYIQVTANALNLINK